MPRIPHDKSPDSTLSLLLDPYGFISKRCQHYGSDVFEARHICAWSGVPLPKCGWKCGMGAREPGIEMPG